MCAPQVGAQLVARATQQVARATQLPQVIDKNFYFLGAQKDHCPSVLEHIWQIQGVH